MDVREDEERQGKPSEDLIPIPFDPEDPKKVTYIRASLQGPFKKNLTRFLQEDNDVFAWTAADMRGIDPQLIKPHVEYGSSKEAN